MLSKLIPSDPIKFQIWKPQLFHLLLLATSHTYLIRADTPLLVLISKKAAASLIVLIFLPKSRHPFSKVNSLKAAPYARDYIKAASHFLHNSFTFQKGIFDYMGWCEGGESGIQSAQSQCHPIHRWKIGLWCRWNLRSALMGDLFLMLG